jgi:HisJ family histidinol phosphate phosphatase
MSRAFSYTEKPRTNQGVIYETGLEDPTEDLHEGLSYDTNVLREIADGRAIPELNHVHSSGFSDGEDAISSIIYEAASMGVPYLAITDHADAGFIRDEPGFYGDGVFNDPESIKFALEEIADSENAEEFSRGESFDIYVVPGMEINYHEDYEEEIEDFINEYRDDLGIVHLAVHHDSDGNNYGRESHFNYDTDIESKIEENYNSLHHALDFADNEPLIQSIVHFGRIENNPFFQDVETPGIFHDYAEDFVKESSSYDVRLENNAKTDVRSMIKYGHPTIGNQVLQDLDVPMSGGTDTHRVGRSDKVDYKINESERRLQEIERVAEKCDNMETILDDISSEDVEEIRLPIGQLGNWVV